MQNSQLCRPKSIELVCSYVRKFAGGSLGAIRKNFFSSTVKSRRETEIPIKRSKSGVGTPNLYARWRRPTAETGTGPCVAI
jgi:hypothetical protein